MAIMLPVMLMLLFTYIFGNAIDPSGGYVDYVVPGIILLCAGFGVGVDRRLRRERHDHGHHRPVPHHAAAQRARCSPGTSSRASLRNLVATAVVIVVALLVGFRPTATPLEWVAAFGLVALYILAITYLFAAIGLAASKPRGGERLRVHPPVPAVPLERVRPVETMPDWLQWIAENQPITPIIETIRALLMGTPMGDSAWWAVGWCVVIIAVSVAWGAWLFRRKAGRR